MNRRRLMIGGAATLTAVGGLYAYRRVMGGMHSMSGMGDASTVTR